MILKSPVLCYDYFLQTRTEEELSKRAEKLLRNFAALAFLMAGVYETMACQLLMPFLVGAASTALAELMYRRKKKGV